MTDDRISVWAWLVDKVVPTLLIATVGLAGTTALTVRSNSSTLADLRATAGANEQRIGDELNRRAADCAAVQAMLHALNARLGVAEAKLESHNTEAERWKTQIGKNESAIADIRARPAGRADPFTGSDGRELEKRIRELERYADRDDERMKKLLSELGK